MAKNKLTLLGLNWYRNAHYHMESKVKREYQKLILSKINKSVKFKQIKIHYKLYTKTKQPDGANIISIVSKYLMDALVDGRLIEDDNIQHVVGESWEFINVDKNNPRVEVKIIEVKGTA